MLFNIRFFQTFSLDALLLLVILQKFVLEIVNWCIRKV